MILRDYGLVHALNGGFESSAEEGDRRLERISPARPDPVYFRVEGPPDRAGPAWLNGLARPSAGPVASKYSLMATCINATLASSMRRTSLLERQLELTSESPCGARPQGLTS